MNVSGVIFFPLEPKKQRSEKKPPDLRLGVAGQRTPSFELKNEQKTKLFIHFFDVSKVICSIIQQLKGCIVWLPTVLDLKV